MANHKSAIKRHRQSEVRRVRNNAARSRIRHAIRQVRESLTAREVETAQTRLHTAESLLGKAVTKGVLHKKTASRYLSRLSRGLHALRAA
jgi:small subunit ribosomal protein S20